MATKKPAIAPVAKTITKKINRHRRNANERKCLSKTAKRVFAGSTKEVFKAVLLAEQTNKRKSKVAV
jgi:hypothetical protein